MRYSFLLAFLFLAYFSVSTAGDLKVYPEKPKTNELLKFEYSIDADSLKSKKISAFIYCFSSESSLPDAFETELHYDSLKKFFKGTFTLPKDIIYVLFKVGSIGNFDDNKGNYWETFIYNEKDTVYQGAYLKAGISLMGNLPENIRRFANFLKSEEYFKKELKLYPDNVQAKIALTSLQFDLKIINQDTFQTRMNEILEGKYNEYSETDIRAISRALKALNKTQNAEELENEFAKRNPKSELAEEKFLNKISTAETFKEFSNFCIEFLSNFPLSINREKIFSALIDGYVQVGKFKELRELFETIKDVPSTIWSQLAYSIASDSRWLPNTTKDDRNPVAISFMENAMNEAKKDYFIFKPKYLSLSEWKETRRINLGITYQEHGKLLDFYSNYEKSANYYKEAKTILNDNSTAQLFENLVDAYYNTNKNIYAFETASEAIKNSKASDKVMKYHQELFYSLFGTSSDYNALLDSLETLAKQRRIDKLKNSMLNITQSIGQIQTLDGLYTDLDMVRGKVILLYFWATWCGPCQDALNALEYLNSEYKESGKIAIIPLNVWEKSQNRISEVKDFIKDNEYKLPVYLDNSDNIPKKLGITGLPTLLVIDLQGNIQYKYIGLTSEDDFVRDIEDIIELLTTEKGKNK